MVIRPLETFEEYEECTELQRLVWEFSDRDLLPARYLKVTHMLGGSVLGAFEPPGRLVAFAFAQLALHKGRLALHSNILAVHPQFQNQGIGARLKLEQRREALSRGITLMTWTFDPLQARNAYLNLNKLGAIARTYLPNAYGAGSSSNLHGGLGTDRVLAEWWMDSPRVETILKGAAPANESAPPTCVLQVGGGSILTNREAADPMVSVEIPAVLTDLMASNMELARQWRNASRELLPYFFSLGYQMTRLVRVPGAIPGSPSPFRTYYVLEACENRSN